LRVAILTKSAGGYGADAYFPELVEHLEGAPSDQEFVILTHDAQSAVPTQLGARVKVISYERMSNSVGLKRALWDQVVLPRVLRELKADVVYTASNVGVLASPCPCVIAIQNMEPLAAPFGTTSPRLLARQIVLRALTAVSLRRAARVVAVSAYVRDFLVRWGVPGRKLDLVYNAVNASPRPTSPSERGGDGEWIASSSKFVRYANLTTLVDGFAELCRRGYPGRLVLAGGAYDRRYERAVRTRVAGLRLAERFRFLGHVPRARVRRLMGDARVFVFASRVEACPFTVLEALSEGAAIVTSSAGPMPELCGEAALYFDPDDPLALADAVRRLCADGDLRASLRRLAGARATLFCWSDAVARLAACFRAATGRPAVVAGTLG
jgi:glycosyltransferase involved in cell wall biosynthesis